MADQVERVSLIASDLVSAELIMYPKYPNTVDAFVECLLRFDASCSKKCCRR